MAILQTTGVTGSLSISSSGIRNSGSGSLFNVNGYNGRLLNVVDSLSGSLFSVNTAAGLPVFEVFSNNRVVAGKFNANDFVISGSRVGIGTSIPGNKLDVRGAVNIGTSGGSSYLFANYNSEILTGVDSSGYYFAVGNGATSNIPIYIGDRASAIIIKTSPSTAAGSEKVRITSAGSVGIGTSSPLSKLDVRSGYITTGTASSTNGTTLLAGYYTSGNLTVLGTEYSSGGPMLGYAVTPSTTSTGAFLSSTTITIPRSAYVQDGATHRWYIGASQTVAIGSTVTTSEVMRIDSNGNVGIGTTSPSSKLHISNTAAATRITITDDVSNGRSGYIESNYSDALVIGTTSGVRSIKFAPDNTTRMIIDVANGCVGIGTTSPAAKLHVSASATTTTMN